jgi:hypothetical protein
LGGWWKILRKIGEKETRRTRGGSVGRRRRRERYRDAKRREGSSWGCTGIRYTVGGNEDKRVRDEDTRGKREEQGRAGERLERRLWE